MESPKLINLLRSAIVDRLGDKTVGISLSGGLDSSTVACLSPRPLMCFHGYYEEVGFDERQYARLAAGAGRHELITIRITPGNFVHNFEEMCKHIRPPIMGMGTFGQYMVAKFASQYVQVLLSGEGSDELFGGYARQMIVAGEEPPQGYESYALPKDYPTSLEEALAYDYARLPDLLAVDDQMTGAWGLQARAPFTDVRIVEYALALPVTERVGKRHLRERVRGIVPDAIIDRKEKMGFPIPLVAWAHEEPVRSFVMDRIGYLPDPGQPWDRSWWIDMVNRQIGAAVR